MTKFNKLVAVATSFALASAVASCTPTIGKGTEKAMTADGYDISSGLFIFYTIRAYQDAANIIKEQNGSAPTVKEVKNSHIDNAEAEDWIQNKAVEYCVNIAAIENEFDKIGGQLTNEELDEIDKIADQKISSDGSDNIQRTVSAKIQLKLLLKLPVVAIIITASMNICRKLFLNIITDSTAKKAVQKMNLKIILMTILQE